VFYILGDKGKYIGIFLLDVLDLKTVLYVELLLGSD